MFLPNDKMIKLYHIKQDFTFNIKMENTAALVKVVDGIQHLLKVQHDQSYIAREVFLILILTEEIMNVTTCSEMDYKAQKKLYP